MSWASQTTLRSLPIPRQHLALDLVAKQQHHVVMCCCFLNLPQARKESTSTYNEKYPAGRGSHLA